MYLTTFKLKEAPFQTSPDSRYLYLSKSHARAKAYLESAVSSADDFVVITGEPGSGKTLLVDTFRRELDKSVVVAHLTQAPISTNEFLQALLEQFGYIPFRGNRAALLGTLNGYLAEQRAAGRKVLLIMDEAQNLGPALLEQLRSLLEVPSGAEAPMRVILVGQPPLGRQLDAPESAQLAQRVRLRFHLTELSPDQVHGYIVHRLAIAGSQGRDIFQTGCFEAIDRYAGGAPRLINSLCDAALSIAAKAERDHVLPEDIEAAATELKLPPLSDRPAYVAPAPSEPPREIAREAPRELPREVPAEIPIDGASAPGSPAAPQPAPAPDSIALGASVEVPAASERTLAPIHKDMVGARIARLLVMNAGELLAEYPLHIGRMMIGRAADADLQIDDRTISRHHCQIISNQFLSVIQDLNSTNGVYVKDQRLRRHNLSDGDVVILGSFQVTYLDERESEPAEYEEEIIEEPPPRFREVDGESTQN
jgi:type II secretory pathway predicted ATPase ExeA